VICASCGTENRTGSRFCDNCGAPLASNCPTCGEPNRADARFCANCGSALGGDAPTASAPTAATAPPATRSSDEATAERRLVTVLFTDLVGFTTLAEDRDPEAVRDLLSRYFDAATQAITLHGGTVEKFIGDAVMAVWGTPTAHEDDAERAVRAALEIVATVPALHPGLQARAGVLTGEAAVTLGATNQGMVAGDLVNTAARLQGIAEAGTVLVGDATRRGAERAIVFEPLGDHSLKGKTSPVPAWRAVRVVAQRGGQGRADALEPPFTGRDEELRQLKDVLHAVGRESRPRLVSITGPGGIGKSRLVWELEKYVDGVSELIYWHRGRSPSYGEGVTFWALGEMVRRRARLTEDDDEAATRERIAATLDELVADPGDRERIGPALLTLLGVEEPPPGGRDALFPAWRLFFERIAEHGTTALVFEDLQWADTGLLDFIDHLLDWARGLPIMVVTLARPELFDRRPDWGANRRHLTALALEPLTDGDMRQLLEGLVPGLPGDALAAIVGRAEGVPLYAVEMVRGLLADGLIERQADVYVPIGDLSQIRVPDSLRSLIASRLDALQPDDRTLLQDASVLGQVFSAESLGAMTGSEPDALTPRLRDLVRRELLDVETDPRSPERGQFRFVQSLIREVAYGTLARRERRSRHLAVARHYEAEGDDELAGALASHYLAAHEASDEGPEADAIATQARLALTGAADRAAALGSHDQAVTYLEQALAITTAPGERAALLDRAARSAASAARTDAQVFGEAAIEAYRAIGDEVGTVAATARFGRVLIDAAELDRAKATLEAIIPTAEKLDDPSALAAALANLARARMRLAESGPAIAAADRALAIAERLNLEPIIAEGLVNKGSALNMEGRRREGGALEAVALEIAQRIGDRSLELRIRNNYANSLSDDDPVGATRNLAEAADVARDVGDRGMYNWLVGMTAVWQIDEGRRWDENLAALKEAYESALIRTDRLRLRIFIGLIEGARRQNLDEYLADITELSTGGASKDDEFALLMTQGEVAMRRHAYLDAYRVAMECHAGEPQNPEIPLGLALAGAMRSRDPEAMRDVAAKTERLAGSGALTAVQKRSARAAAAAADGRIADAVAGFQEVHAELVRLGQMYRAATFAIDATVLLPDQHPLRELAQAGRPLLEELGAVADLEVLDDALASAASVPEGQPATASAPAPPPR
jgi:class 3 adenylate cyclase/tetratricopeptide (TPR) repeat protein